MSTHGADELALTFVRSTDAKAKAHILDPMLTKPPRTICGVRVVGAWTHGTVEPSATVLCGNCDRMRLTALESLKRIA
jgi:molybdenum cofactor biosynthesis enzyme MoaA